MLVADRDWRGPARDAGWTVDAAFERRVHRSLTRHVLVLRRGGDGERGTDAAATAAGISPDRE